MPNTSRIPERVTWAVAQLAVRPADRLLEIGCGPGHAVALLCPQLTRGSITAIDRSVRQVALARERNRPCITMGRARIEQLTFAEAPAKFGERAFTKAFTINVNIFWTARAPSFASLSALLRPGSLAYLIYEPPNTSRLRELRASLPRLLRAHGFFAKDMRTATFRTSQGLCVIARPSRGKVQRAV